MFRGSIEGGRGGVVVGGGALCGYVHEVTCPAVKGEPVSPLLDWMPVFPGALKGILVGDSLG